MQDLVIHWFRRDLRLDDNTALNKAIESELPVLCIFIFDKNILNHLKDRSDKRVLFIHQQLEKINKQLKRNGSSLLAFYGNPLKIWKQLIKDYSIKSVFCNRDYEPYAQKRDQAIFDLLSENKIEFKGSKDHVIFEKNEVLKKDGKPYTVFTPYSRRWRERLESHPITIGKDASNSQSFYKCSAFPFPLLSEMGFEETDFNFPEYSTSSELLKNYADQRNFPAENGTSKISVQLRFGTLSIRKVLQLGEKHSWTWVNELIWRDFYQVILYHFPTSVENAFKAKYSFIKWRKSEEDFEKWCQGKTGYPMVDAGMRELNETGFMHNRVRMVVASFLTKHLLIDWRLGEAYFAEKLLDFELASNVGGWQWASGTGCDAAPYFRIFNPTTQLKKFDPELKYVKKWVKEYGTDKYPLPMVEHKFARERALSTYKAGLAEAER